MANKRKDKSHRFIMWGGDQRRCMYCFRVFDSDELDTAHEVPCEDERDAAA